MGKWERPKVRNNYGQDIVCPPIKTGAGVFAHRLPRKATDNEQLNALGIMGDDSIVEIKQLFGRRSFYIGGSGDFLYDPVNEPVLFLMKAATSGLNK